MGEVISANFQPKPTPPELAVYKITDESFIIVDDHCYCVVNWNGEKWGVSGYVYREAIAAIKSLPSNPDDAKFIVPLE